MTRVYKILPRADWDAAVKAGRFEGSGVDARDGFIHFSTAAQAQETAAKHFAGRDDLVLVALAAEPLGDRLRWEPSRGGALFPHLYRRLTTESIRAARALTVTAEDEMRIGAAA